MFHNLNEAATDEIKIGDQEEVESTVNNDDDAGSSQETEDQTKGTVEDTDSQADAEGEKTDDVDAKADDAKETEDEQATDKQEDAEKTEDETDHKANPDEILKEATDGKIESVSSLSNLLEENQRLKSELEKPRTPEFANERAKLAYEYLQKHSGDFQELTKDVHRILSLDTEGMNDKELQFEAFALKRKDLNRKEAREVFNLKYQKLFGELEDDPDDKLLQDELRVNSIEAKATIKEAQTTLQSELTPKEAEKANAKEEDTSADQEAQMSTEDVQQLQTDVKESLEGFEALQVKLGKEGKEEVNIHLDQNQKSSLEQAMLNPGELVDAAIAQFGSNNGTFNYKGYRDFITKFIHHDRIVQETYNQGINVGKLMALDGSKNLDTKEPPALKEKGEQEQSFADALIGAYQGRSS